MARKGEEEAAGSVDELVVAAMFAGLGLSHQPDTMGRFGWWMAAPDFRDQDPQARYIPRIRRLEARRRRITYWSNAAAIMAVVVLEITLNEWDQTGRFGQWELCGAGVSAVLVILMGGLVYWRHWYPWPALWPFHPDPVYFRPRYQTCSRTAPLLVRIWWDGWQRVRRFTVWSSQSLLFMAGIRDDPSVWSPPIAIRYLEVPPSSLWQLIEPMQAVSGGSELVWVIYRDGGHRWASVWLGSAGAYIGQWETKHPEIIWTCDDCPGPENDNAA